MFSATTVVKPNIENVNRKLTPFWLCFPKMKHCRLSVVIKIIRLVYHINKAEIKLKCGKKITI